VTKLENLPNLTLEQLATELGVTASGFRCSARRPNGDLEILNIFGAQAPQAMLFWVLDEDVRGSKLAVELIA